MARCQPVGARRAGLFADSPTFLAGLTPIAPNVRPACARGPLRRGARASRSRPVDRAPRGADVVLSAAMRTPYAWPNRPQKNEGDRSMAVPLPNLPYAKDALAPHISAETLEYHHGKHHAAYVNNLNKLIEGKPEASKSLEDIIKSSDGGLFNNAAQVWNHTFYWSCMKPNGGGQPTGDLAAAIQRDFGSFDKFAEAFSNAAATQFGSGWAWLVLDNGKLAVTKTGNADLPMKHGQKALLTLDVWEHAYYIDYRNARPKYIETFLKSLVNWDFALENLKKA
jgi:Fe-Mn family superoxide dismutase